MTDNQQRADELWAALNIAGLDGEMPEAATTARVASAYRAALDAAEARGRAEVAAEVEALAEELEHTGMTGGATARIRALVDEVAR